LFFAQAPAEGIAGAAEARPAGKDAFAVLMQQARQEQGKQCSSSGSTAEKAQAQAPTDALSFLMQQARGAQQSTASAPSASRCGGNLISTIVIAAIIPLLTISLWVFVLYSRDKPIEMAFPHVCQHKLHSCQG